MAKKKKPDWELIEKDYRLGQKSMRTMAKVSGVSHSTISRRAKKEGWVQDKTEEVRVRTKAALIAHHGRTTPTRSDVDVAVKTNVQVIREHRKDIQEGRSLVGLFFCQLRDAAENRGLVEEDIFDETKDEDTSRIDYKGRTRMLKAVALPSQAAVLRDLSTALKNLIGVEREAFNLDADKDVNEDKTIDFGKVKLPESLLALIPVPKE